MDQRTETFLITHKTWAIDKYCFPGQSGNGFFELFPPKWPDGIAKIFEEVGKLTVKNNIRLIRGEVREQEGLTYIWVEAGKKEDIEKFYVAFEKKLISVGHHYDFDTVKIIPDNCQECTETNLNRDFKTEMVQCQNAVNDALDLIEDSKTAPA